MQTFFIYHADKNPASSSLKALPACTEPSFDMSRRDGRLPRGTPSSPTKPRLLADRSMGLWCRGRDEFVVAELNVFRLGQFKVFADIYFLRSSCTSADDQLGGTWYSKRVDILCRDNPGDQVVDNSVENDGFLDFKCIDSDVWQLYCWQTDTIIPCKRWLCWIDYQRGILFRDLSSSGSLCTSSLV